MIVRRDSFLKKNVLSSSSTAISPTSVEWGVGSGSHAPRSRWVTSASATDSTRVAQAPEGASAKGAMPAGAAPTPGKTGATRGAVARTGSAGRAIASTAPATSAKVAAKSGSDRRMRILAGGH